MEVHGNRELTYLYAGDIPFAIHEKNGKNENLYYLHLDYQGSIRAITDEQGNIVEQRDYDAWGRPRNATTLEYTATNPFSVSTITNRGYTFHEHIFEFSLINMNARMYDPVTRHVISPDNLIPDPDNTQAYNRYTYCYNNPLKYIDPDGNEPITLAIILAVKVAAKVATKVAASKAVGAATAKAASKTAVVFKSKAFAATTSGTVNAINNTDFNSNGWGWEAMGHFTAGFLGGYAGADVSSTFGFVIGGTGTVITDMIAGDIDDAYDLAQSFAGGGLSGVLGGKIHGKAMGYKAKKGLASYMKSGAKNAAENWVSAFAFDKEDKFLTKRWDTHLGVLGAGFANGFAMGVFDANSEDIIRKLGSNDILSSLTDLGVKTIGATIEFGLTSYAKYGKLKTKDFGKKGSKAFVKNLGFVLVTYY